MENATLKPYPDYKSSGIDWLGDVPAHWDIHRCKSIMVTIDIRSETGLEELLSVSADEGVIHRKSANVTMFKAESYIGHKLCWPGDLVINSLWAWAHGLGVSNHHGIVSTAYGVYRLTTSSDATPRYIHYITRSRPFQWELQVRSKGIWTSRLKLTDESFLDTPMPLPSLDEQTAIVRYLDRAADRIRRAISAKERLIGLLTEQRQAVIHRAVTRGLDPNVPLRDSGVEWLGDVPAHWESTAVKRHYEVQLGKMLQPSPNSPDDVEVPYLKAQHVHWNHIRIENAPTMWARHKEVKQFGIRQGDLLIVEGGAGATNSGILEKIPDGYIIQNALHRVRPKRQARNDFLLYMMMSVASSGWFEAINNKATIPHFTKEKLDGLPMPRPPLEEQAAIVRYLDKVTADIDTAINKAQRQIDLLREYRTRLIADVVTGQVDVRGAAGDEVELPAS